MTEQTTEAGPRQSFWVTANATGWWWNQGPRADGWLHCYDGRLRFERERLPRIGRRRAEPGWEHTHPRIVLASPSMPIPNHFTIVIFEGGAFAVAIPGNRELLRTTLVECGFEVVEMPPARSWPRKLRADWARYGGAPTP